MHFYSRKYTNKKDAAVRITECLLTSPVLPLIGSPRTGKLQERVNWIVLVVKVAVTLVAVIVVAVVVTIIVVLIVSTMIAVVGALGDHFH